jgi:hypothetical protein
MWRESKAEAASVGKLPHITPGTETVLDLTTWHFGVDKQMVAEIFCGLTK